MTLKKPTPVCVLPLPRVRYSGLTRMLLLPHLLPFPWVVSSSCLASPLFSDTALCVAPPSCVVLPFCVAPPLYVAPVKCCPSLKCPPPPTTYTRTHMYVLLFFCLLQHHCVLSLQTLVSCHTLPLFSSSPPTVSCPCLMCNHIHVWSPPPPPPTPLVSNHIIVMPLMFNHSPMSCPSSSMCPVTLPLHHTLPLFSSSPHLCVKPASNVATSLCGAPSSCLTTSLQCPCLTTPLCLAPPRSLCPVTPIDA